MESLYNIVLVLHIVVAIVAFGGLATMSAYNSRALKASAGAAKTLFDATVDVTRVAHGALYAVAPLGIVLVSLSGSDSVPKNFEFSAVWISISFVVWFAMIGVAHALVLKNLKAAAARAGELDPTMNVAEDPTALAALKKMGMGDAIGQILLLVALALMIWQPGN